MREQKTKELRKFCDYRVTKESNPVVLLEVRKGYRQMKKAYQKLTPVQKRDPNCFLKLADSLGLLDEETNTLG